MTQTIELVISARGETRLETKGFAGSSCQAASQFLEEALGHKQTEQLTSEFYQPQLAPTRIHNRGTR